MFHSSNLKDNLFKVIGTSGDSKLGGDDFDHLLLDYILNKNFNIKKPAFESRNKPFKKSFVNQLRKSHKKLILSLLEEKLKNEKKK